MSFIERLLGRGEQARRAEVHRNVMALLEQRRSERQQRHNVLMRLAERELGVPAMGRGHATMNQLATSLGVPLSEGASASYQGIGNPWWSDMSGLFIDDAWRKGFPAPFTDLAYWGGDEAMLANDDTLREHILKVCRALYTQHPHARGIVNGAIAFVCGSQGWSVEPTPKCYDPGVSAVRGVFEDAMNFNAERHPRGPGGKFAQNMFGADDGGGAPIDAPQMPMPLLRVPGADAVRGVGRRIAPVIPGWQHPAYQLGRSHGDADELVDEDRRGLISRRWKRYIRRGTFHPQLGWTQFWVEATRRFYRDGEVFIHLGHEREDGRLAPRFLEPEDIVAPHGATAGSRNQTFDQDANGIRVDADDPSRILGFWWKPPTAVSPRLIPAGQVLFLNHSTDSTVRRGLPYIYTARHMLRHFDTWVQQALKHQRIQGSVALLRSWGNADQAAVSAALDQKDWRNRDVTTPAGNQFTYRTSELLPVIDSGQGMQLQGFAPHGNFADSEILARRVLLAVATAVGQSEAMVTADGSNANYASTRITQFIPLRHFELFQGLFGEIVTEFYEKWCRTEALLGRLPPVYDELQLDCNVTPARLPNFEAEIVAGVASALRSSGIVSLRTSQEMCRIDPDVEKDRMADEELELAETEQRAQETLLGAQAAGAAPAQDEQGGEEPQTEEPEGAQPAEEQVSAPRRRAVRRIRTRRVLCRSSAR